MAVTSEVDICNIALGFLGQPGITALVDDPEDATSKSQKWCSRLYAHVRDNLLECHPWQWASTLVQLTEDADYPPEWGFEYAYLMPTNYLRLCELDLKETEYAIETHPSRGRRLLTDADEVYLRYVWRVVNPLVFPQSFVEALARRLAAELVYPLTGNKDMIKLSYGAAQQALSDAKRLDFGSDVSYPAEVEDTWISSRTTG